MNLATTLVFLVYGQSLLADLSHPVWFTLTLTWLLLIILLSVFAVVRHAESLAAKLGEPLGTLVLTMSVTGIEVMIIVATMSTGEGSPTAGPRCDVRGDHDRSERHGRAHIADRRSPRSG